MGKVEIHEEYTIEIGGEVIGGLTRTDLDRLRAAINGIIGPEISFPQIQQPIAEPWIWTDNGTAQPMPENDIKIWCSNEAQPTTLCSNQS